MKYTLFVEKLRLLNKKYITKDELKDYCKIIGTIYYPTIIYLTRHYYLIRLFRGIFYIPSIEERKYKNLNTNFYEIISTALKMKGVANWYFGLNSAIKLNNLTHETNMVDYIINDKIFRSRPMLINGHKIKFIKIKPDLFKFGIISDANTSYSDIEKTILDIIYLARYNKIDKNKIFNEI